MKSYVIYLPSNAESVKTATKLKHQLEEFEMEAELFVGVRGDDAVHKMTAEGREVHPWGIKGPHCNAPTEDNKSLEKVQRPGVKGCFYSHYLLWQKCADLNEPIIIWEDDIVLTRPYIPIEWRDVLILALGHPTKSEAYRHLLESPEGTPAAVGYARTSMPGCCGYAIHPHAAQKLLETYANTYLPADNAINQYHVIIQVHSHVMGTAILDKKSLTSSKSYWSKQHRQKRDDK